MEISDFAAPGELLELLDRPDADNLLHVLGGPYGNWVAPVSVSGEAPVLSIDEPVVETLLLDERGHPGAVLVVLDQLLLDIGDLDEPGIEGSIDKRGV